jgi:hypothetical protein
VLTLTEFLSRRNGLILSDQVILLLVGDCPIRQLVLCEKDFGLMALWELNTELLGSLWLMASATSTLGGGDHIGWRSSWLGKEGRAPFELYPGICQRTQEEHGKPQSRWPSSWRLLVAPAWTSYRDSFGWPAEHQSTSVTRGWLQSALGRHKYLSSCWTDGYLASANSDSKLAISALMWWRRMESPNSRQFTVTDVPRCVSRNAKTLGL